MARPSLLSDELVRQLVAVGQVDIIVGVPTFNHAASIDAVVKAVHVGLAKHFPRERTVLVNANAGSDDGTVERVRGAPMADEELRGSPSLRTTHRVSAVHSGLPGRATGTRIVFAAADLLQARAVVLIPADATTVTPDWVGALARPAWRNEADVVLPIHARSRFEGPLVGQLVRPLLGAAFARRLSATLVGGFCCSGRFAARLAEHGMWESELSEPALDVWLVATALADNLRVAQVQMGPCVRTPHPGHTGLAELVEQVVGTTFACLERHAAVWLARNGTLDVPVLGEPFAVRDAEAPAALEPMAERFRAGVRDLEPLLREILSPATLARLQAAAEPGEGPPRISDPLWVTTVYEFAASAHRAVMKREHLTQALVPLYLGRTASFFADIAAADDAAHRERVAALERAYEELRPHLVERWNADDGR